MGFGEERCSDADAQNTCDDGERETGWNRAGVSMSEEHFYSDECENENEACFDKAKPVHDPGKCEVQRSQGKDRKYIGGEDEKRVGGYGEDGRNGVNGEQDVGAFHDQKDEEQGGHCSFPVDSGEEVVSVVV